MDLSPSFDNPSLPPHLSVPLATASPPPAPHRPPSPLAPGSRAAPAYTADTLPPMHSSAAAASRAAHLHLPSVHTYIQHYHYYNFTGNCTVQQAAPDGQPGSITMVAADGPPNTAHHSQPIPHRQHSSPLHPRHHPEQHAPPPPPQQHPQQHPPQPAAHAVPHQHPSTPPPPRHHPPPQHRHIYVAPVPPPIRDPLPARHNPPPVLPFPTDRIPSRPDPRDRPQLRAPSPPPPAPSAPQPQPAASSAPRPARPVVFPTVSLPHLAPLPRQQPGLFSGEGTDGRPGGTPRLPSMHEDNPPILAPLQNSSVLRQTQSPRRPNMSPLRHMKPDDKISSTRPSKSAPILAPLQTSSVLRQTQSPRRATMSPLRHIKPDDKISSTRPTKRTRLTLPNCSTSDPHEAGGPASAVAMATGTANTTEHRLQREREQLRGFQQQHRHDGMAATGMDGMGVQSGMQAMAAVGSGGNASAVAAGSDSNGASHSDDRGPGTQGQGSGHGLMTTNSSSPSHGDYTMMAPMEASGSGVGMNLVGGGLGCGSGLRPGMGRNVDESTSNDWEAVVEMYVTGKGTEDGVALKMITKGDGRRVCDRKLLEKRRTIGKTYECLGMERFEAAIGYKWENRVRRKQKMYHVISRCRVVNAMRKSGEEIPEDVGELTALIDGRIAGKEAAKEAGRSGSSMGGRRLAMGGAMHMVGNSVGPSAASGAGGSGVAAKMGDGVAAKVDDGVAAKMEGGVAAAMEGAARGVGMLGMRDRDGREDSSAGGVHGGSDMYERGQYR